MNSSTTVKSALDAVAKKSVNERISHLRSAVHDLGISRELHSQLQPGGILTNHEFEGFGQQSWDDGFADTH